MTPDQPDQPDPTRPRMQEGWERRHAALALDAATIAALLQPAFLGHSVRTAVLLGGGLANTNYKVTLDGIHEPVVLRLFTRDPAACQTELDIYHLAGGRMPMPAILYADPTGVPHGRPYLVARWIEGVKLDALLARGDETAIASAARAAGATLAGLTAFPFARPGFFGPSLTIAQPLDPATASVPAYVDEALFAGAAGARLGPELTRALQRLLRDNAALLTAADTQTVLVHGDYKAQNLLVRRAGTGADWNIAAVLDWEFAFAGSPLFDVAICLRYGDMLPPAFTAAFAAGYRDHGGILPPDWRRIIRLLDLVNLCGFLSAPDARGAMIAEVTSLVRATVAGWLTVPRGE